MKILVVEDEKISRLYLETVCKQYGYCETAENGKIADDKIRKSFEDDDRYDLIFLDIMLSEMTGQQVLQLIRAYETDHEIPKEEKTKVIMASALKDSENVKRAYSNFADGYIVKPILKQKIDEIFVKMKK